MSVPIVPPGLLPSVSVPDLGLLILFLLKPRFLQLAVVSSLLLLATVVVSSSSSSSSSLKQSLSIESHSLKDRQLVLRQRIENQDTHLTRRGLQHHQAMLCVLYRYGSGFCLNVDCIVDLEEKESEVKKSFRNEQVDK